jgi:hypothetical protein
MIWVKLFQEATAESELAAVDLPDKHDEAFLLRDAVSEMLQSLLVGWTEIEKFQVGSDVEGYLLEPLEALIHAKDQVVS